MDADTYPNPEVADFFNNSDMVLPLRLPYDQQPQAERFQVRWTPCLIVLDTEEKTQQRAIGYQSPEELIPWVILGAAKARFSAGEWEAAQKLLQRVITDHPATSSAPEAVYFHAVADFMKDHDGSHLKAAHLKLSKDYPDSIWVERTYPYTKL